MARGPRTDVPPGAEHFAGPGMIHGFFDMGRWSPGAQVIVQHSIGRFGEMLRGG